MLVVIDIETAPGVGFETYEDAALDHNRNHITQIAVAVDDGRPPQCYQTVGDLNQVLAELRDKGPITFGGHNFKFDLKTLIAKGANIAIAEYTEDSMLQAAASPTKIPADWLAAYETERQALNKKLGKEVHRKAGEHSLKTLAAYHIGVSPFWEVDGHDSAEYAMKDAQYTLMLIKAQATLMEAEGSYTFYKNKLIPWSRMFTKAELTGLLIDQELMATKETESTQIIGTLTAELAELWKEPEAAYRQLQLEELDHKYTEMAEAAKSRPTKKPRDQSQLTAIDARYRDLYQAAMAKIEPLNLASPSQLMWVMRDFYGLDMRDYEGNESTGIEVLEKVAAQGHKFASTLVTLRAHTKRLSGFIEPYKEMLWNGRLYPSFNLIGARTGRISCSTPNLMATTGDLHPLYIADPGYKFLCYDLSNIEPMLIAYLTEDPLLCQIMLNGESFHDWNVKAMFGKNEPIDQIKRLYPTERGIAKTAGLAILYGAGFKRVQSAAQAEGVHISDTACKEIVQNLRARYAGVWSYKQSLDARLGNGEAIPNLLGRLYRISDPNDVYMKGFNTWAQGSGSDLLLDIAYKVDELANQRGLDLAFLASIHDEFIMKVADKDVVAAQGLVQEVLASYKLPTQYGNLSIKMEGGAYPYWKH